MGRRAEFSVQTCALPISGRQARRTRQMGHSDLACHQPTGRRNPKFGLGGGQPVLYLGRVRCRGWGFRVFGADAVGACGAVRGTGRVPHGYGIAKDTGLKSGSLYPILIRLAERGLVEARWEEEQPAGRPRRHLYRLTPDGLARAQTALAERASPHRRAAASGRAGRRRVAEEGA